MRKIKYIYIYVYIYIYTFRTHNLSKYHPGGERKNKQKNRTSLMTSGHMHTTALHLAHLSINKAGVHYRDFHGDVGSEH